MLDFELILETIITLFLTLFYIVSGMVKAVLPVSWLPKKDISKDTALVTGAGSGIGRALAISLAKHGCRLVLWDINEEGNEATASEIKRFGGRADTYTVDLSKREDVYKVADQVLSEVGVIDILVNNAGIVTGKTFLHCPDALIEKSMQVNAMAHFWTTKAFLPAMIERDHGHIVSIASTAGLVGVNGLADYCASKFAAVGFMESLCVELNSMHKSIETTSVCTFFVKTGLFDGASTRFPSILPILETDFVVSKITDAILTNQRTLYIPKVIYSLVALKGFLPDKAAMLLQKYTGTANSMDQFTGRQPLKSD
ncbi:epidermal retinol dehydrogenase 2-like isoform X1 [Watersipora subatra]|uniref:epidermal retinol dehydrogenase 2-like isoform X1 n=1 Tax=Watersipora subatra TaxID=2589382 RepID=UPI00355B2D90